MTEFTSSHGVRASMGARKPTKTLKRYLAFEPEEHPISAQLFGSDPAVMADAARVCQDLGFDILDINFGCPVNKVVKSFSLTPSSFSAMIMWPVEEIGRNSVRPSTIPIMIDLIISISIWRRN